MSTFRLQDTQPVTVKAAEKIDFDGISSMTRAAHNYFYLNAHLYSIEQRKGLSHAMFANHVSNVLRMALDANPYFTHPDGRMIKRLSATLHKQYGINTPSEVMSEWSSIIARYRYQEMFARLSNKLTWRRGDYGDPNSCFWGERTYDRELLAASGAYALLVERKGEGVARCFVYPDPDQERVFLFNAYGLLLDTLLDTFLLIAKERLGYANLNKMGTELSLALRLTERRGNYHHLYVNNGWSYVVSPLELDTGRESRRAKLSLCACAANSLARHYNSVPVCSRTCTHCVNHIPAIQSPYHVPQEWVQDDQPYDYPEEAPLQAEMEDLAL